MPTDFERPFVDALDFTSSNTALTEGCHNYGTANQAEPGSRRRINPPFLYLGRAKELCPNQNEHTLASTSLARTIGFYVQNI